MPISWNEIRDRARAFSAKWNREVSEDSEAKSFWDDLFHVYGQDRKKSNAFYEYAVKRSDGSTGYIDLLWKGILLVEHKSRGKDLSAAFIQAKSYLDGLKSRDRPDYIVVSDFHHFHLHNLQNDKVESFTLPDLHKEVRLFGFMAGYETQSFGKEKEVSIKAVNQLGQLHDLLEDAGYKGHNLEVLMVRLLFCLFAEDTGAFPSRRQFQDFIEQRTAEDGSDLGARLMQLFQTLNKPEGDRQKNLDEQLAAFPYVNGNLFADHIDIPDFTAAMRESLLETCALDWSQISPAIFGSLFQSIKDRAERRAGGEHYTTETNILKALRPLFLDALHAEFASAKRSPAKLRDLHTKLANLRLLDPACGCGNFLVVAYRELRLLELEVLKVLHKDLIAGEVQQLDISTLLRINVDQFYGIEIAEFPAQIAQVALWLTDHQMNMKVSEVFGRHFARLPLKTAPHIVHANALTQDWAAVVPPEKLSYIVGNPPFSGATVMSATQKSELMAVFTNTDNAGNLDFCAAWYRKAADYMAANPAIRTALVSTNSITQGEQVGILWPDLIGRAVKINFAHRTFQWLSEAPGKAAVHCIIIGFALQEEATKTIFDYAHPKDEPAAIIASHINPYLADAQDIIIASRSKPICDVSPMNKGSQPTDGGNLLFNADARDDILAREPSLPKWIRPFIGSDEFLNGIERYCFWLIDCPPEVIRSSPELKKRIAAVKEMRLASTKAKTREDASRPSLFTEIRQPKGNYLLIPRHSSERRLYIPFAFFGSNVIAGDANSVIPNATLFELGVISSIMHMAWVRAVCGRIKSDYRYSNKIVYNNFPWPSPTDAQKAAIEKAAQAVLAARAQFAGQSLAALYDPLAMPPVLLKAHQALDKAVDAAYRKAAFATEAERVAYLFTLYQQLTAPLAPAAPAPKPRRKKA